MAQYSLPGLSSLSIHPGRSVTLALVNGHEIMWFAWLCRLRLFRMKLRAISVSGHGGHHEDDDRDHEEGHGDRHIVLDPAQGDLCPAVGLHGRMCRYPSCLRCAFRALARHRGPGLEFSVCLESGSDIRLRLRGGRLNP